VTYLIVGMPIIFNTVRKQHVQGGSNVQIAIASRCIISVMVNMIVPRVQMKVTVKNSPVQENFAAIKKLLALNSIKSATVMSTVPYLRMTRDFVTS